MIFDWSAMFNHSAILVGSAMFVRSVILDRSTILVRPTILDRSAILDRSTSPNCSAPALGARTSCQGIFPGAALVGTVYGEFGAAVRRGRWKWCAVVVVLARRRFARGPQGLSYVGDTPTPPGLPGSSLRRR